MRRLLILLAAVLAAPAVAQTPIVDQARTSGIAGERYDGFMGLAGPASTQVRREVSAINIKRRALYAQLAQQRGVTPDEVGLTAGCQLLAGVQVGESYYLPDGHWHRRAAGTSPPVPDYCR